MQPIEKLEKQQIDIRLPKYLIIDSLTKEYNVNRTDIITEAISLYRSTKREAYDKKALEEEKKDDTFEHNEVWDELLK